MSRLSPTLTPALIAAHGHGTASTPRIVVVVAVLAAALVLLAGLWLLARWASWEPTWWRQLSHVADEAGVHLEATWADFRDWLRLGR